MTSDPLTSASRIAASGLEAQSRRLLVVSENMANAQSTSALPGGNPYQRKLVTFAAVLDRSTGASPVEVLSVEKDRSPFPLEFNPGHQAADASGYVKMPNVNMLVEMADMREASRHYDANLQVLKQARNLVAMTIDLLKA